MKNSNTEHGQLVFHVDIKGLYKMTGESLSSEAEVMELAFTGTGLYACIDFAGEKGGRGG